MHLPWIHRRKSCSHICFAASQFLTDMWPFCSFVLIDPSLHRITRSLGMRVPAAFLQESNSKTKTVHKQTFNEIPNGTGSNGRSNFSWSEHLWCLTVIRWPQLLPHSAADIIISLLKMRKFIGFCERSVDAKIFMRRSEPDGAKCPCKWVQRLAVEHLSRVLGHPLTPSLQQHHGTSTDGCQLHQARFTCLSVH